MKIRRLAGMGAAELVARSRQEARKWLERACAARTMNGQPQALFRQLASDRPLAGIHARVKDGDLDGASQMFLNQFQETSPSRFFDGAVGDDTPTLLTEQLPGARDEAIAAAEMICRRRFDLLGHRGLWFGDPVNWHLDPISGRRAPLVHWSRLDPLDPCMGDCKVIWELNRHQWLIRLGIAYRLTKDERYAKMFAESVQDWIRDNPRGMGINWASSLEVSLRLISWCWAVMLFRDSEALSPDLFVKVLSGISAHASHVEKYLSYYFSPNTHLTGEALGLFYAGVLFPELRRAEQWRNLGMRILIAESERQILPDGVYFEHSTCYQRYTVEIYLHLLILAARDGIAIPAAVGERVQRLLDCLLSLRRPDGSMPQIGDADGGWLLPLATRAPEDFRGIFSTAAVLFDRPDYAWAADDLAPETLWLLGSARRREFDALKPTPPARAPSRLFAEGGYAVMQSDWERDAHQLIFDVGPLGCPVSGAHGHADLLSIQCSVFGEPFIVDAGTYCYASDPEWREFFRGTMAHNTVTLDGVGQALTSGPFQWEVRPRARLRRWLSNEAYDFADADHDAYSRLPDPVIHRRRILFVRPRYWVVVDDIEGSAEHLVELHFQFAPIEVSVDSTLWARARGAKGNCLLIKPFASVPLKGEVHVGELTPIRGWVSPIYGQRNAAPVLTYSTAAQLPLRIITLLLPTESCSAVPPHVSPLEGEGLGINGLSLANNGEIIRFSESGFAVEHQ